MAEYIEREAFIKWVEETYCKPCEEAKRDYNHCRCGSCQYDDMMRDAESFESADVAPVRHGRWIQHYEPYDTGEEWIEAPYGFECSECGRWEAEQEPFCNCGAKMQGESNE